MMKVAVDGPGQKIVAKQSDVDDAGVLKSWGIEIYKT